MDGVGVFISIHFLSRISGAGSCPLSRQGPASPLMKDSGCVLSLPLNSLWKKKGKKRREGGSRKDREKGKLSERTESRTDFYQWLC